MRAKLASFLCLMGGVATAVVIASASCGKTTTYQYVDVAVAVDSSTVTKVDLASQVVSCEMFVMGAETSSAVVLPCTPIQGFNLGTFEWTTTLSRGSLQFVVTLFARNRVPFAAGTSDPVEIVAGKKLTASVLVVGIPGMTGGAGGAGGGTGAGGQGGAGVGGSSGGTGAVGGAGTSGAGGMAGRAGAGGAGGLPAPAGGAGGHGGTSGSSGGGGMAGAAGSGGVGGAGGGGGVDGAGGASNGGASGAAGAAGAGGDAGGAGGA